jgi:DHA1 family inner membrane transport protein
MLLVTASVATSAWGTAMALWVTWCIGFGFPSVLRVLVLKGASEAPTLAAMLTSTASNLGVAVGAALGSATIAAGWGYGRLPVIAAACMAVCIVMVLLLAVYSRSRALLPATSPAE